MSKKRPRSEKFARRVVLYMSEHLYQYLVKRSDQNYRNLEQEVVAIVGEACLADERNQFDKEKEEFAAERARYEMERNGIASQLTGIKEQLREAHEAKTAELAEVKRKLEALQAETAIADQAENLTPHGSDGESNANTISGFKGVYSYGSSGNKWQARTMLRGKSVKIGVYASPRDAAFAYDEYCRANGLKDRVNFPTEEEKRGGLSEELWRIIHGGPAGNPSKNDGFKFTTADGKRRTEESTETVETVIDLDAPLGQIVQKVKKL